AIRSFPPHKSMQSAWSSGASCGWSKYTTARSTVNHSSPRYPLPVTSAVEVTYVHMSRPLQVRVVERPDPLPSVLRRVEPVRGAVDGEERVAGAVVGVELEGLA